MGEAVGTDNESLFAKPSSQEGPRKIPEAIFIDDVAATVGKVGTRDCLLALDKLLRKYKFMETRLAQARIAIKNQLPQTERNLEVIRFLKDKRDQPASEDPSTELKVNFEISDQLFVKAVVDRRPEKVALFLGANVMVEVTVDEAESLLDSNVRNAKKNLDDHTTDLAFLRDQINITEVNTARTYNYDIVKNRAAKK